MTDFAYVEIDMLALVYLILAFVSIHHKNDKDIIEQKLFLLLLSVNALMLVLDAVLWVLNGKPGYMSRLTNIVLTSFYFIFNPVPCILWGMYANYLVYNDNQKLNKLFCFFLIPLIINSVISAASCFTCSLFYFDLHNVYHRGKLFMVMPVICFYYLFFTLIFIIKNQKRIEKRFFIPILAFAFPPFIGGILQTLFYGLSLSWPCMAISIQIIYINIQNEKLYKDPLTGLYNRRQLDCYLQGQIKNSERHKLLAGIMIDINSFKDINDIYGHLAGDQALIKTGKILNESFRRSDLICRYGGDEFVIMAEVENKSNLSDMIKRINSNVEKTNKENKTPYKISLSIGYDIYNLNTDTSVHKFFNHIDNLMYENKNRRNTFNKHQINAPMNQSL